MTKISIDLYMDYVIIEGQRVNRPPRLARSVWMAFWEQINRMIRG